MGTANTKKKDRSLANVHIKQENMKNGRKELYKFLHTNPKRATGRLLRTAEGFNKKVDIFEDTVVTYPTPTQIDEVNKFHKDARSNGLQEALNPIIHTGTYFVMYPRCENVTQSNLPENYKKDLNLLGGLQQLGFWDYHRGNIMLCQGHLKVVDQEIGRKGQQSLKGVVFPKSATDAEARAATAAYKLKTFTSDLKMLNKNKF